MSEIAEVSKQEYSDVSHNDQALPVEMDKFWPLSQNKVSFQQFFIKWLLAKDTSGKTIYLGGNNTPDENACILTSTAEAEPLLRCFHEEADDRIMYHLSHAVKMDKYRSVIISSPDTDVLVCAIYNFSKLLYFGLAEFWFITGKRNSRKFIPVHEALDIIESETIDILLDRL